ncbi:MAG TPA: DUF2017 domain-containing protein [Phycicoccus sp.]|nr:DUF2017 domain-containing protein [Phycicoccus sp.]HQK31424.1 DUF2017 domain-containing protein [Phycicoccus sp.]HQY97262.1 DUF2017 domain-containing protein [Phycicoccus sp.]
MARGFRRRGHGKNLRYAARLDPLERAVIAGLMEQVVELLDPPSPVAGPVSGESDFDHIVAGLGGLGMGVSVAAEDQDVWPDASSVPADARSFGELDPALQRLLPAANREDEQASAEFRRLTEAGLRARKAANLELSLKALRREGNAVEVDATVAHAMLVALTDVRLVLGERLGLRDDEDVDALHSSLAGRSDDDPVVHAHAVYDFLTWLQETLAEALLGGLERG